jgi:hypothetical protein
MSLPEYEKIRGETLLGESLESSFLLYPASEVVRRNFVPKLGLLPPEVASTVMMGSLASFFDCKHWMDFGGFTGLAFHSVSHVSKRRGTSDSYGNTAQ